MAMKILQRIFIASVLASAAASTIKALAQSRGQGPSIAGGTATRPPQTGSPSTTAGPHTEQSGDSDGVPGQVGDPSGKEQPPPFGPGRPPRTVGGATPSTAIIIRLLGGLPPFPGGRSYAQSHPHHPPAITSSPTTAAAGPSLSQPRPRTPVSPPGAAPPSPPPSPPNGPPATEPAARDREILVTLSVQSSPDIEAAIARDLGLAATPAVTSPLLGVKVVRMRIPDGRLIGGIIAALQSDARVVSAQPNFVYRAVQAATAGARVPQYVPGKLHLDAAHAVALGRNVTIAVIDTAIDSSHPALVGAVVDNIDTSNGAGSSPAVPENHGTSIAGVIAARTGFTGVAPAARLLEVRAFRTEDGEAAISDTLALIQGLDWAAGRGARLFNMSFAGPDDPLIRQGIAALQATGAIIVAAAGNGGASAAPAYPAAYPVVIAVTATDGDDRLYDGANRGAYLTLAAPGVDVVAPVTGGRYEFSTGTSMAAAHVSGVVALVLERAGSVTASQLRSILAKASHKPHDEGAELIGAGIVDAAAALDAVR